MSGLTASNNRAMTAHFLNAAISVSLKSSMCYLHCTTNIDGSDRDSGTFTIEPEPGTTCQAQCWKNWDQTKQLEMFGLDKLMKNDNHWGWWGANAEEFLTHSYNHWQRSQFRPDVLFPTIDQVREGTSSNSSSGAAVPVCYSPQPIQSYKQTHNRDKALPCICGNEIGNETVSFFREANFQSWIAVNEGKGLAEARQTSFQIDKTWPVQAYLAFCHLGWHFPVQSDQYSDNSTNGGKHRFGMGADVMCEQAEKEAQEVIKRGGSITDVNCNLCWLSKTGKTIKENQRHYVHHDTMDHRNKYHFQKACEEQMGNKEVCKLET